MGRSPRAGRRAPARETSAIRGPSPAGLALLAALLLFLPRAGPAQGPSLSGAPDPALPWEIEAERLREDREAGLLEAEGEVVLWRLDRAIEAERIRYHRKTGLLEAEGHVVLRAGGDEARGERLAFDLAKETGWLDQAEVFIRENDYRIRGERIEKTGPNLYRIPAGEITTCEGSPPDWKISGRDIRVGEDGAGTAWHALLHVRDLPLFYTPFVSFPARNKRQSGFLFPETGYSRRKGAFYGQPYFWAIDDQKDLTLFVEGMTERGLRPGAEFRYYLDRDTKGAVLFDFLHDDKVDDGSGRSSSDWGHTDPSGDYLRPNRDRYWLRASHVGPLGAGASARLDLDLLSDQDYLRLIKSGPMGWRESDALFREFLGRTLDDFDDPVRVNRLWVSRGFASTSLGAGAILYDDVRKGQNRKETTQRLPVVVFAAPKQQALDSPLHFSLSSEYDHFYRRRGFGVQRADLWPRLFLPWSFYPYLTVEPSVGFRQTLWQQYATQEGASWSEDEYFHRELYDTRLVLGTEVYRVYDTGGERIERLRHRVAPEIAHTYVPEAAQERLPNIDSRDRIENRNRVSYALTQTFTARVRPERADAAEADAPPSPEGALYLDLLRWRIRQYYDFARHREPFSAVTSRVDLLLLAPVRLEQEIAWNPHTQGIDRGSLGLRAGERRGEHLFLSYRWDRDTSEDEKYDEYEYGQILEPQKTTEVRRIHSLRLEGRVSVSERWSLLGSYERDIESGRSPAYGVGFVYDAPCWAIEALFGLEEEDLGARIRIRLKGIGEFGF
ncbi:MAG: LPS assembly protein LptD [Desulfobacterales bacterium]